MKRNKKKCETVAAERELESLRASYQKVLKERNLATGKLEELKRTLEELKKKHGNLEHVLGDLVGSLQHEIDMRDVKIHRLEEGEEKPQKVEVSSKQEEVHFPDRTFQDLLTESRMRDDLHTVDRGNDNEWEDDQEDEVKDSSGMKWLLALGAVAVLGIGVAATQLWLRDHRNETAGSGASDAVINGESGEEIEKAIEEQLKASQNRVKNIQELFEKFFDEQNLEKKAGMCRYPKRTLAHMMVLKDRQKDEVSIIPEIGELEVSESQVLLEDGSKAWRVSVQLKGEKTPRMTFVYVNQEGGMSIDWETFFRFQSIPWEEFIESKLEGVHEMHLLVGTGADIHPDYPLDKYYGVRVRGWEDNAYRWNLAFISKDHPDAAAFIGKISKVPDSTDAHGLPYQFRHYILGVRFRDDREDPLRPLIIEGVVSDSFSYREDLEE